MQIKKHSKNKNLLIIISCVILAGSIAFVAYQFIYKPQDSSTVNTPLIKGFTSDKQQSKNLQTDPSSKNESPNADKPAAPTTSGTSNKKQVQMTASTDTSSDTVFIRGGVNYPVTGGRCFATLTGPSGQILVKDTTVLQGPASTDCKTISIPVSELSPGKWSFILQYESDEYEGASASAALSI